MLNNCYKLKDGKYLDIDETSNGYEYSLYEKCKVLIDGGILEYDGLSDEEALTEIFKRCGVSSLLNVNETHEDIREISTLEKIINDKDRKEIIRLFDDGKHEEALKKFKEKSRDPIIDILLNWYQIYREELNDEKSNEYMMYLNIFRYLILKHQTCHLFFII